ncbi:MAG: phosphoribosylformylglycinamidine cyclo-ligase [Herpetosiphonaceae bacterium]|nr:MAG: phosphoribosylformylglycinamidine cyclo-ligase [Herpetosiphonaceae bacterium]
MTSYRDAGVDIAAKMRMIAALKQSVESTQTPAVLAGVGAFGGCLDLSTALPGLQQPVLVVSTDGVGTKTLVAAAVGRFDTVGADLVNHCINDILCQGATPLLFMDYIAAARLEPAIVAPLVEGIANACKEAGIPLLGGETAEMPGVYAEGAFDLAGTIIGVVERDALITGRTIQAGDAILALPSTGLHTNGYSLARKVLAPLGYDARPEALGGQTVGEALLAVHRSYANEIKTLRLGGVEIRGLAHITGGGLWDNLPRILPEGVGAVLWRGSWHVPPIFGLIVERAGIDEHEAFHVFNMGLGMLVVVPQQSVDGALAVVPDARAVGEIVTWDGQGPRVRLE